MDGACSEVIRSKLGGLSVGAFVQRGRERSEKHRLSISSFFKVRKRRMKTIGLGEISMSRMINAPEERDPRPSTGCLHKHSSIHAITWFLDRGDRWPKKESTTKGCLQQTVSEYNTRTLRQAKSREWSQVLSQHAVRMLQKIGVPAAVYTFRKMSKS